jgi:Domain of unknown function (DUF4123)/FHA domain
MRLTLEMVAGPAAPRGVVIAPGTEVRVGRKAPCEVVVEADRLMSRQHLVVTFDGTTCRVRDLNSGHGTFIKEESVGSKDVIVPDGEMIRAGATFLRVRLRPDIAVTGSLPGPQRGEAPTALGVDVPPLSETHRRVLEHLKSLPGHLYAVLDAARDEQILGLLMESAEHYQSLYEGEPAGRFVNIAPYLVALPGDCEFLETLVREGWGKSWGVYLTSDRLFDEVRKHLRRFLKVQLEDQEGEVLFRYYDPRVLRVFLPTCAPKETSELFGPIKAYIVEEEKHGSLAEYMRGTAGVESAERLLQPSVG